MEGGLWMKGVGMDEREVGMTGEGRWREGGGD
jgi:hypothetical protein